MKRSLWDRAWTMDPTSTPSVLRVCVQYVLTAVLLAWGLVTICERWR